MQGSQDLSTTTTTTHFAQIAGVVTEDMVAGRLASGPDAERHIAAIEAYATPATTRSTSRRSGPTRRG